MYRIGVCDDKEKCRIFVRGELQAFFSRSGDEYTVDEYVSGDEFLFHLRPGYYDIVFFDVEMSGTNGIDAARRLRGIDKNVVIIFTSAHRESVFDGFLAEPLTFLTKPLLSHELQETLLRALQQVQRSRKKKFIYTVNKTTNVLPVRDILYLESSGRVVEIVSLNGRIRFYGRVDNAQNDAALEGFLRCHQSFLVNPDYIMEIRGTEILLTNGDTIPIRRGSVKELRQQFMAYLNSMEI